MSAKPQLRIGSRGSRLSLIQAEEVRVRLAAIHPDLDEEGAVEIVVIRTTGDRARERPLAEIGGKGLFTKEIEDALLEKRIDLAVHSVKDVPAWLPAGLVMPCVLPREDPRDALVSPKADSIAELAQGASVGTASPRRRAQLLMHRPDLRIVNLRGNVETRLRKIREGRAEATLVALAGLNRLGMADRAAAVLEPDEMMPAIAQGAIGVECRADDERARRWLEPVNDPASWVRVVAERAFLAAIGGSCRTPIAALAELEGEDGVNFRALILRPDGTEPHRARRRGRREDAAELGAEAGLALRAETGPDFFEQGA